MATRTISTRLALEGESEYKAKLKNINAELSLHKSELEKAQAKYKDSANSMAALTAKQSALEGQMKALNQKHEEQAAMLEKARKAQKEFSDQTEELRKRLDEVKNSSEDTADEEKRLNEEIAAAEASLQKATNSATYYQRQLNITERDQANLSSELEKTNRYLDEAKKSTNEAATSIDKFGKETSNSKDSVEKLAQALAAAGVARAVGEIAEALRGCADASIEFESAITGVYKTVDGTDEQLAAISDGIKKMSTEIPASTTQIAAVAEAAGQLGIETDNVLAFTRVMIDLGESTNLSAEEAASALAKFANIVGTSSEDYSRLGSVIVALGNNFATTEADILAMSTRLASAGELAGLSESEIMALAAAMSSVGIEAEAGGTAMTQTLTAIESAVASGGDKLEQFAAVAGVSSAEFAEMWKTNAISAIQSFIDGLGKLDEQGESATLVLDEMGLSGVRQSNMLKSLGLAADELSRAVGESSKAWEGNTALSEEASKRYATTESRLAMCGNAANNLKIAIGDALTPALGALADAGTAGFSWAAEFVEDNPWLVQAITGLVAAVGVLATGIAAYTTVTTVAKAAQEAFNLTLMGCPVIAVAAAVTGLAVAIGAFVASMDDADENVQAFTNALEDSKAAYEELSETMAEEREATAATAASLQELLAVEEKSALQKDLIVQKVAELNEAVPGLGLAYDKERDALEGLTEAELASAIERAAAREEYETQLTRLNELDTERVAIEARLTEARLALNEAEETGVGNTRELQNNINELTAALDENAAQYAELQAASAEYAEQQAAAEQKTQEATRTVDGLISEMKELQEAYNESYAAAMESIDGQIGLFNEMDGSAKTSIDNLIGTLQGQVAYMETYAANIQRAMELGVDEGLIRKLSDGSEESAQILAAIVEGGEEDIAALNEQLARAEEGKEAFSQTVAEMENDFSEKMKDIEDRVKEMADELDASAEAQAAGMATIDGYINGAESMRSSLISTYRSLATAANNAYKSTLDINSPSRVFREHGKNTVRGAIEGVEEEELDLERAYSALAESAIRAYQKSRPTGSEAGLLMAQREQTAAIVAAVQSRSSGESSPIHINVERLEVRDDSDVERVARELYYLTERERRSRGGGSL